MPHTCQHTSLSAGTFFQSAHLPLTVWLLRSHQTSRAKTDSSALALKRNLGVRLTTACLLQQKRMQVAERDTQYTLAAQSSSTMPAWAVL
jgi:hypothetical protein